MVTKYFIHGGFGVVGDNTDFYREILTHAPNTPRILLVYFAKDIARIPAYKVQDMQAFQTNAKEPINFEIATESEFAEQVKRADVVYIRGGKTLKLLQILQRFDVATLFTGKVIVGESAGAYVLSTRFYSKSENGAYTGLSLVPIKTICHFIGENVEKLPELDLLPVFLAENTYQIFDVEATSP